jgi:hypothetical protein
LDQTHLFANLNLEVVQVQVQVQGFFDGLGKALIDEKFAMVYFLFIFYES